MAPKKAKKGQRKKGGKSQPSQPPPPSHSTIDYSHFDKIDTDDSDAEDKPSPDAPYEEGGYTEDEEDAESEDEDEDEDDEDDVPSQKAPKLEDFPSGLGLDASFGKLMKDPDMMKKLSDISESMDGPIISNVSRVIPPGAKQAAEASSAKQGASQKGKADTKKQKDTAQPQGAASKKPFNFTFDSKQKEAAAKATTAEASKSNASDSKSGKASAKAPPVVSDPRDKEVVYSTDFPGLVSDEEDVVPYKESVANGSMTQELADLLIKARETGNPASFPKQDTTGYFSKLNAKLKKPKKGTANEGSSSAAANPKDEKLRAEEADAAYKALLEEEEKERRGQQEKEEKKKQKKKAKEEKRKAQKAAEGGEASAPQSESKTATEGPSSKEAETKETVGPKSSLEILQQRAAAAKEAAEKDAQQKEARERLAQEAKEKERELLMQRQRAREQEEAEAKRKAAEKAEAEAAAAANLNTKAWVDGLVPKKPAANTKKKKQKKQKEESAINRSTANVPQASDSRDSPAEDMAKLSLNETENVPAEPSASLHVEEVSDDEDVDSSHRPSLQEAESPSLVNESDIVPDSEHASDNPFDLLLNQSGQRSARRQEPRRGVQAARSREASESGGAYDSESSNSTARPSLPLESPSSGNQAPSPGSRRPKSGPSQTSMPQMPKINGYAPPDRVNGAQSVWALLDSALNGNTVLLSPAIDAANMWIEANEKSNVFRPIVAELRKRVEMAKSGQNTDQSRGTAPLRPARPQPSRPLPPQRPAPNATLAPQRIHPGRGGPVAVFPEENDDGSTLFDPFGGVPMGGRRIEQSVPQGSPPPGLSRGRGAGPTAAQKGPRAAYRPTQAHVRGPTPFQPGARTQRRASEPHDEINECIVCFEWPPQVTLEPCRHSNLCRACADKVRAQNGQCPTCRMQINFIEDL